VGIAIIIIAMVVVIQNAHNVMEKSQQPQKVNQNRDKEHHSEVVPQEFGN
jgi:low affinity Fe/Cu permease